MATALQGMEALASQLAKDLSEASPDGKPNEHTTSLLQRIKDELRWSYALSVTKGGMALLSAMRAYGTALCRAEDHAHAAAYMRIANPIQEQVHSDLIHAVAQEWWSTVPVPERAEHLMLVFTDITAAEKTSESEVWPPETVEGAPSEPFEHVAQRFRVRANQAHRHPLFPSRLFDAVLKDGKRVPFEQLAERTVADVLATLADPDSRVVPYVRRDEDSRDDFVSPALSLDLWDRGRALPAWCITPDHWIEPTPPPGYVGGPPSAPPASTETRQYYKKIPTLHVAGRGRHIMPSASKPDLISRSLFVPVQDVSPRPTSVFSCALARVGLETTVLCPLAAEDDLVPAGAALVPGRITLAAARALLGRVVQSSQVPLPDPADGPRPRKRRKTAPKWEVQRLGFAWGLETDGRGSPSWLLCVEYGARAWQEYALDLSGQEGRVYEALSERFAWTDPCAWVGAVVLPADLSARGRSVLAKGGAAKKAAVPSSTADSVVPEEKPPEVLPYKAWNERTKRWIAALNDAKNAPVVEVGPDGTFVGGDLGMSMGDEDEFEAEVTGAKPGVWLMSLESADQGAADEDGDGAEEPEAEDFNRIKILRFIWTGEGQVDYDALPPRADVRVPPPSSPDAEWETVGSFSADLGMVCLFSKASLDALLATGPPEEREAMLESFIDDDDKGNIFLPSGMLISGNHGAYNIMGRYDEKGDLVELKVQESYLCI